MQRIESSRRNASASEVGKLGEWGGLVVLVLRSRWCWCGAVDVVDVVRSRWLMWCGLVSFGVERSRWLMWSGPGVWWSWLVSGAVWVVGVVVLVVLV